MFRLVLALSLILALLLPIPAYAATVVVNEAHCYENIYETDDAVCVVYYTLGGGWATELGVAQVIEDDGSTLLQERSFNGSDGLYYLTGFIWETGYDLDTGAGDNGWGDALTIRLMGNPTQFASPPTVNRVLNAADWHTSADTDNGRNQLKTRLTSLLNQIEADDSTIADGDLVVQNASGWQATSVGATVVLTALPILYEPVPGLFSSQTQTVAFDVRANGTLTNGTGTATGSPITLQRGDNTVTVTVAGDFVVSLPTGNAGTARSGTTGVVTDSPVTLPAGNTTITVPGGGTGDIIIYTTAALQAGIDAATDSDTIKPNLIELGEAFGFGNFFAVLGGLAAVVSMFVLARKQEIPSMAALGLAVPMSLFAARAGILPLGWVALAAFIAWFVGLWRAVRPSGEMLVYFVAFMYLIGVFFGAIMEGANVGSGALDVLGSQFSVNVFSQADTGSNFLGTIFSTVNTGIGVLVGLIRMAFWDFTFWNDLGVIKWLMWFPVAFAFYYKLYTAIFGRG